MTVAWFVEYEHEDGEEWSSVCFSLMQPEIEKDGQRIHRMLVGLRHDRFIPNIQTMDQVYESLGLTYLGPEKPDYVFELWAEPQVTTTTAIEHVMAAAGIEKIEPMRELPQEVVTAHQHIPASAIRPQTVGSEVLMDALMPFARLGEQMKGMPFKDYEAFPGTVSVGWLRNAARALGRDV